MTRPLGPAIREAHAHGAAPWDIARAFHVSIAEIRAHLHGEGSWRERAACAAPNVSADIFFPDEERGPGALAAARAVCRSCPVQAECLQYALDTGQQHGVWGGTGPTQRRAMRGTT